MITNTVNSLSNFLALKTKIISIFLIALQTEISFLNNTSLEKLTSTALLITAVLWLTREQKKKEDLFIKNLDKMRDENAKALKEKEERIIQLTNEIIKNMEQKKGG